MAGVVVTEVFVICSDKVFHVANDRIHLIGYSRGGKAYRRSTLQPRDAYLSLKAETLSAFSNLSNTA